MPEYVYALFDFAPENPDEIQFKAGERIEIVEKDDVYGDGWWQVSPLRSAVSMSGALSSTDTNSRGEGVLGMWGGSVSCFIVTPSPQTRVPEGKRTTLSPLFDFPLLPHFPMSRLAQDAHLFLLTRAGQQLVALVCSRKVLPRRLSQSSLQNPQPSRFMNQNQSYIRLPPCKLCGRSPRPASWALRI